ncbi:MAG TPA: hypothetical protein VM841_04245 [Actinomycetota bacterium]|nr:hypothetical protein [Actinomycetota bacterium]
MSLRDRAAGIAVVVAVVAALLPASVPAQTPSASPSPDSSPGATSSAGPAASPAASESPSPTPEPVVEVQPGRSTDTEYLKVKIDRTGEPEAAWLKNWIRLRGSGTRTLTDAGRFAGVTYLDGTPGARETPAGLRWRVGLGAAGFKDLYYEGRVTKVGDYWMTASGLKPLPVEVRIRYYTGAEGSETEVAPEALGAGDGAQRFKIVVTLTNRTKRFEEVSYNDIQTGRTMTATAPVSTPYVARIVDLRFPDDAYDRIQTDGEITRQSAATVVNWTRYLIPPDFPEQQTAIVTGVISRGAPLPEIKVVAQPVYPAFDAEALNAEGTQFQRGRRNFFYDVFGLFRENLVALTGLFGLLHDSFANLSLPLLGPEKGNREAGSFDEPNQLWALWTLTKGIEQLDRAFNVFDSTSQLLRDAVKGSLATLAQLRAFVGYSTDKNIVTAFPPANANEALLGSIWSDLKTLASVCGEADWSLDTRPYFPETPLMTCPALPQVATSLNLIFLKLALVEHDLQSVQKENHELDTALLAGLANTPFAGCGGPKDSDAGQTCDSYSKYLFIKFPFGLEEIERALWLLKTEGFDAVQAAIGNKDQPNSLVQALHVLTEGTEAQIDAFHQLGATWRYVADSIQNFAIFGVESARNILQWDINAIDVDTAVKAASVRRAKQMSTFMGSFEDPDGEPALGQLVVTFSTAAGGERPVATDTRAGKTAVAFAGALLLATLALFGRFRWHVI